MKTLRTALVARLTLVAFAAAASLAHAQSSTPTAASTTTTTTAPAIAAQPTGKLVDSFADLAGSPANATSLVNGLRTGSAITLTDPNAPPGSTTTTSTTTFSPGTKPMGYGNIRIALSLARTQLASQGITNPTPEQLQGALIGTSGTTGTATQGILQMRASGMGWGKIANSLGVKLGTVMSGRQTFPTTSTSTSAGTTTASGTSTVQSGRSVAGQRSGSGVVTAAGTAGAGGAAHGKSGITTAAGGLGRGGGVTTGLGTGGGQAASGAVNASGGRAGGAAGASNAGGQGRGKP